MKAMVLAAGVGSRLDPLTAQVPKPLVPVTNVPVMEHIIGLLKRHGIEDIIANLHYLPEKLRHYFTEGEGKKIGVNIEFRQEEKLSGDAGGVRFCRDFLGDGTFIVLMGDLLTDADLTRVIGEHKRKGAIATIALKQVEDVTHFGVAVLDENGFIKGFQEKPKAEDALSNLASTGIYILEPKVFDYMPAQGDFGFGRQLFPLLVEKGEKVLGVEIGDYWSDVGTIEQYWRSNFDVLKGKMKAPMQGYKKVVYGFHTVYLASGAELHPDVQVHANAIIGKGTVIESGVVLTGNVVLADDCTIGAGTHLEDVIAWSGSDIKAGSMLKNAIVTGHGVTEVTVSPEKKNSSQSLLLSSLRAQVNFRAEAKENLALAQTQVLLQAGTCV